MKKTRCLYIDQYGKRRGVDGYEFYYQDCRFVVTRFYDWAVIEPVTALFVKVGCKTRKEAIEQAKKYSDEQCKRLGMTLQEVIDRQLGKQIQEENRKYNSMPLSIRIAYLQGYQPK